MAVTFGKLLKAWGRAATFRKRGLYDAIASTKNFFAGTGNNGYSVLDPNRKILTGLVKQLKQYGANELSDLSLPQLRALCRQLERDSDLMRAAVEGLVAQVVGTGIGLSPDTGDPELDDKIGAAFDQWCKRCDATGKLSVYDLQCVAIREWFLVGEHVWRKVIDPERLRKGMSPLFVVPLESEWLAETTEEITDTHITTVHGMTLDRYGVPLYYHIMRPGTYSAKLDIVDADEIIHGFERRRGIQNRGEPWAVPVIERIHQAGDLIDTELKAAINASGIAVVVTSEYHASPGTGASDSQLTSGTEDDPAIGIGIGSVARLYPGEDAKAFSHDRPGQQIAPFVGLLKGGIAGASRVSRRWLDRDYSNANFSSQRADEQDSRRLLLPVIEQLGHSTIGELYLAALPFICAQIGVAVPGKKDYTLLPDGQPYVNPVDDINAASASIAAGLSTHEQEIAKRGGDIRSLWAQLKKEKALAKELGITLDLSGNPQPPEVETNTDDIENKIELNDDNK